MNKTKVFCLLLSCIISFLMASTGIAHEKVVVIPLNSSKTPNPLQGQGRPGVKLMTHDVPNGFCTSPAGVNFALSESLAPWEASTSVCPADTWVCSNSDLPSSGSCLMAEGSYIERVNCDGNYSVQTFSILYGYTSNADLIAQGHARHTLNFSTDTQRTRCVALRAWCCWK